MPPRRPRNGLRHCLGLSLGFVAGVSLVAWLFFRYVFPGFALSG